MIFDPVSVVATHLTEVCRTHLPEIITLEFVNGIMDQAWKDMPVTVEAVSKVNSLLTIRDVYRRLLTERVSVRDVETILNVLVSKQATVDELVADCRVALRRAICAEYANQERVIRHLALDPATEGELLKNLRGSSWSDHARARYVDLLAPEIKAVAEKGLYVIFVVSPRLRQPLRQLLAPSHPNIVVLSTDEIEAGYRTESVRTFTLPALSENR